MAADKERGPGSASADIGKFLDILAKDPKSRVFASLAEAYRKAGLLDDAIATALEGLRVHPNYLSGRVALGRAYFEKQQFAEAAAEMRKVVASSPENLVAHKVLGQIAETQGDLAAAAKAFRAVLFLDPQDREAKQFVESREGGAPAAPSFPKTAAAPPAAAPPAAAPAAQPAQPAPPPAPVPPPASRPLPATQAPAPSPAPSPTFDLLPFEEIPPLEEAVSAPASQGNVAEQPAIELSDFPFDVPPSEPAAAIPEPPPAPVAAASPVAAEASAAAPQEQAAAQQKPAAAVEESPIETFGRPLRGGPPKSAKGEEPSHREFDIDSLAAAPVDAPASPASSGTETGFEVFTREPGPRTPSGPSHPGRGEFAGPREFDLETTAFNPPESYVQEVDEAPPLNLDEELPRFDLTREMDLDEAAGDGSAPAAPALEEIGDFGDLEHVAEVAEVDESASPRTIASGTSPWEERWEEVTPQPEPATAPVEAAAETEGDAFGEEEGSLPPRQQTPPAREVFDTATLADIYVKQGFYGRAAEIYRRLIEQRPEDTQLRHKLEACLALERGGAADEAPAVATAPVAPTAPAAVPEAAQDERITRLHTLLEAFKGGRPR